MIRSQFSVSSRRWLIVTAAVALVLGVSGLAKVFSDDVPPAAPPAPAPAAKSKAAPADLDIGDHMKVMKKDLKQLQKAAASQSLTPDMADLVADMEAHAVVAKTMVPPNAMNRTGDDQARFIAGYRKKMIATIGQMLQLETALVDNNTKEAGDLIGALVTSMRQGHSEFNKKEK